MTVGENIVYYRERKEMSRNELALKIRSGVAIIEKIENNLYTPELHTLLKISTVLDIPASELMEQESKVNACGMDSEIEQLVKDIGTKRAKLILHKAKEFSEDDFLKVMQMLYELKYENKDI